MRAYWEAVVHCEPGEAYNIGGLTTMTVGEVLETLISLSNVDIPTRQDPALLRPADVTLQVPDTKKFQQKTGWIPHYKVEDTLQYLIEYWRERARRAKFSMKTRITV
jgi:nucleoside-diphosphate-sugar epimerase